MTRSRVTNALGLAILALAAAAPAARATVRYSCVRADGRSIVVDEPLAARRGWVHVVNPGRTATAACLAGKGHADLQWDVYAQAKAGLSKEDENDIVFRYVTPQMSETCDPRLHPNLHASTIELSSDCYVEVLNDVRIDVWQPEQAELVERDRYGREYRTPLNCSEGYTRESADAIDRAARESFAAPGACSLSKAYQDAVVAEERGSEKLVSDYELMLRKELPAGVIGAH